MASAPKRPCPTPFCKTLVQGGGYCDAHRGAVDRTRRREMRARYNARNVDESYTSTQWRKTRSAFLIEHPVCQDRTQGICYAQATVVDHVVPHRGDERLFWDEGNWQALCKCHHDRKTARERLAGAEGPTRGAVDFHPPARSSRALPQNDTGSNQNTCLEGVQDPMNDEVKYGAP